MFCPVGKLKPVSVQLVPVVPLPRKLKFTPSVDCSKVTRESSGLEPPRVQLMAVCITARFCSAAALFLKRAKLLRVCPPMLENPPPAKIFPSVCTAMEMITSSAFGLNESARPVVASSWAMWLRVCPSMLVKLPPAKILPSTCTAME